MIDRLKLIMQAKNMSPAEFADVLEVQRSGISHLLSGRNNPSLGFVEKVLTRFPEISPDWLILGKGAMIRSNSLKKDEQPAQELNIQARNKVELDLFDSQPLVENKDNSKYNETFDIIDNDPHFPLKDDYSVTVENKNPIEKSIPTDIDIKPEENIKGTIEKSICESEDSAHVLEKIVFFYSDHSFKEYKPEK